MISKESKHFTDTIFYQIELTARYSKMLGTQLFGNLGIDLSVSEFSALDMIWANDSLCQRDLAKLLLIDRANTGKLLDSLEQKRNNWRGKTFCKRFSPVPLFENLKDKKWLLLFV